MEQAIMKRRAETHKKKGSIVQKTVLPTLCFAALSTIAFEKEVHAAENTSVQITSEGTQKYVNVASGSLNLRERPSPSASIVTILSKGTPVTVYVETNGWAKVSANGKKGYVNSIYLSSTNPTTSVSTSSTATAVTKYVNPKSGMLNLRAGASTGTAILTSLSKGTAVTVYSEGNGWSKVNVNGKDGYVSSSFLSATNPNSTVNSSTAVQTTAAATTSFPVTKQVNLTSGSLNMRNSPSTSGSIVVKIAKGTSVQVYSEANGWSKIVAYGQTGYVSSEYLSDSLPSSSASTSASTSTAQQTVTEYVIVSGSSSLNLRESNSLSSALLAKLANGTEVQVLSTTNGWAKVQANGQTGYVSSGYLSKTKPNSDTKTVQQTVTKYVDVSLGSSLNMRKSPIESSSIIVKIGRGVEVTVLSEANGWANIEAYGQTGYVSSEYLSPTNPVSGTDTSNSSKNGTTDTAPADNSATSLPTANDSSASNSACLIKYVNVIYGSSLNMRSTASTSSTVIAKLSRGTAVTLESEENGWAKVTANGITGYVSLQYLSADAPFNPNQTNGPETVYGSYNLSLSEMASMQMKVTPQTDKKYDAFIRADSVTLTGPATGTINGNWNVRGGAGTNFWVVGQMSNTDPVQILAKVKGTDGNDWYQINYNKTWVNASPDDVKYYLNPNNFVNNSVDSLQFLKLSLSTNLDSAEVNSKILTGKGILQGQAAAFIAAGNTYGVNEIYLISHALLETGNGTSELAKGVAINGKTVYNMYGIGAYDNNVVASGAQFAYNAGWFTPKDAIIGGAQFIANGYIDAGQDTLYKMRWNPGAAVTKGYAAHEYASDIGWASKQVKQIYNLYNLLDSYKLILEIPKYQ